MTTINSLPPEMHSDIVTYLTDDDLRNYRLVCKDMAIFGAKEYFRMMKFHASSASVQRLQDIANDKYLRKCVQTLVWDSNLWDINVHTESEWKTHLRSGLHQLHLESNYKALHMDSYRLPRDIVHTIYDTEAHVAIHNERWQDERAMLIRTLSQDNIKNLLQQFPALREIRILNGAFWMKDRKLEKTYIRIDRHTLDLIPRGDNLFCPELEHGPLGVHALKRTVEGMGALNRPWKLEIDALDYTFFAQEVYPENLAARLDKLTSLTLALSYWRGGPEFTRRGGSRNRGEEPEECKAVLRGNRFTHFLRCMKSLRSLSLSLQPRVEFGQFDAPGSVRDLIPLEENWTNLYELSLKHIDTSERDFITVFRNHSSTLQELKLEDICLVPDGSWIKILQDIRTVSKLSSATFAGEYLYGGCREEPDTQIWWLQGTIGPALSGYLVNGGEFPLRDDNTVWHGVTSDGHPWECAL